MTASRATQKDMPEKALTIGTQSEQLSTATFVGYVLFLLDFFLHIASRIPFISVIRPTLLLVIFIFTLMALQQTVFKKRDTTRLHLMMMGLLGYLLVSLPFVTFPGSVIRENFSDFFKAIVFFYFTAAIIDSPSRLKIVLFVFILSQLFRVMEPLYLNFTRDYWGSATHLGAGEFANRLSGAPHDVINPNELGFVIVTLIPFLHFLLFPRRLLWKGLYLVLIGCLLYALVLTMSRGAFLVLFVIGWMVFRKSQKKIILVFAALGVMVSAWELMTPVQKDRYMSLIYSDMVSSKSVDGRITGMLKEFELGFKRPVFGHGLGTTTESKYHYFGVRQASHNMYAELIIEIGLVGMFFFLRLIYSIYTELTGISRKLRPDSIESKRLLNSLSILFWSYLIFSINYWGLSQSYWYWLAGLTVAYSRITQMQNGNDLYCTLSRKVLNGNNNQ